MIPKETEKLKALKTQIEFRQNVLGQSHSDSSVFNGGKQYFTDKLKQNLLTVSVNEERCIAPTTTSAYKQDTVGDMRQQPELLFGKFKHRFEVDGEFVWYEGAVVQMNYVTNEFQVVYDEEKNALCLLFSAYIIINTT